MVKLCFKGREGLISRRPVEKGALKNAGTYIPKIRVSEGLIGKNINVFGVCQEQDRQLEESV